MIAVDFTELFTRHHPSIREFLYERTQDWEVAEDLAAEVFAKALRASQNNTGAHSHVVGWLYRISNNTLISYYRARALRQHKSLDEILDKPDTHCLESDFEQKWLQESIKRALAVLSDEQRQVITLWLDGSENADIAMLMGKSIEAVKATKHRAILRLSTELREFSSHERLLLKERTERTVEVIKVCLAEQGAMSITELACVAKLKHTNVRYVLENCPNIFTRVGIRGAAVLWDIAR